MSCLIATTASERDGDNELFHGVIDTGLYTFIGPKPYNYPVVPSPGDRLDPDGSFISGVRMHELALANEWKSLLIPNWITHDVPYMAFAPSVNPFKHQLLKSLDYNLESIPIVIKPNGRYVLDTALQKDWQHLELDIRSFLRALMRVAQAPLEHGFRLWSMPLQHGYAREYNSDGLARIRALKSRNAFIPQIAACSFFIHFIHHQAKIRIDVLKTEYRFTPSDPTADEASKTFWTEEQIRGLEERQARVHRNWEWEKRLREETQLTEEWLSYFKSVLDEPVVGGFMDVHQSRCLSLIPVFCAAKIPLVLFWGTVTKDLFAPPSLHEIVPIPTFDTVTTLISGRKPYVPSTETYEPDSSSRAKISTASVPSKTDSTRPLHLPRITGGTQPRPKEGLFAFLKRRESARTAVIAKETLREKQSRLQREENAKRDMPPGRKGARVYYWEWAQGIRVRTSAGRNNYEDLWERYGARQRHYDSVADEWDVCTDLAPDDGPEGDDWDDAEDDLPFPFEEPLHDTNDVDNSQSSGDYLERLHRRTAVVHPPVEFQDAPDIIAYLRYGFSSLSEGGTRPATTNGKIWRQTMDMLGFGRNVERPLSHGNAGPSLATHLLHLLNAAQLSNAPQTYDLHNRRADFPFTVEWARCGMSSCYALTTVDRNPYPFVLSLPSAAAVIEISRQYPLGSLKVSDVIPYLVHKGMAFDTLVESNLAYTAPIRQRLPSLLGYRSPEFCADLSAYLAYEHRRDTFLRSPRGRAALKYGGLISRLARNVVSIGDVLDGPTDEALYTTDRSLSVWNPIDGLTLFDDRLTDTEIDLICGTYDVATGTLSNNGDMQTAQRSWWPRPAAWKLCGLNCGYWSPDAEDWFQRRLGKIRTNASDVLLHTNNEWRPKLKFNKDAARLCQVNEKLAAEYLESIFHFEARRSQTTVLPETVRFV